MKQQIYKIRLEVNDHGWHDGYYSFKSASDAVRHMRRIVAEMVMNARKAGDDVTLLKVWKDTVTWSGGNVPSQTINVRIAGDFFEYRVFAVDFFSEGELPASRLNY